MIRLLNVLIVVAVVALGWRVLFSDVGYFELQQMRDSVAQQRAATARLAAENATLLREVRGARHTLLAVESRARTDLGMIREGESFFLVVDAD